jgi:hypothetical protein
MLNKTTTITLLCLVCEKLELNFIIYNDFLKIIIKKFILYQFFQIVSICESQKGKKGILKLLCPE